MSAAHPAITGKPVDFLRVARQYERDVLSGKVSACKWVKLACARNKRDLERAGTKAFPYVFDEAKAVDVCEVVSLFPHIKGSAFAKVVGTWPDGKPRWSTLELEPWQAWILTVVFGWVHKVSGNRRYRTALVLVPRKNGKSMLAAAVALYMLACDGESGAEVYSAATTREQAAIVAQTAMQMARREPAFCKHFGVQPYRNHLEVTDTACVLRALSSDDQTLDGLNPSLAVVDEVHAHRTRDLWDVLETAVGARDQALLLPISTAGRNTAGICYELQTYAQKILERRIHDETFFGIVYTIDPEDENEWWKPAVLRKANPNFGVSVHPDILQQKALKARAIPSSVANFKTKHLNVWANTESPWLSSTDWDACARPKLRLEDCIGRPCRISVDLAQARDIASVIAGFELDDDRYAVFGWHYMPEDTVATSPIAQLSGWVADGHLIATDGNIADYQRIEDDVVALAQRTNAVEVLFDPALAAHMMQRLQTRLGDEAGEVVITVEQTVRTIDPAMKLMERMTLGRRLLHDGDPVLAWMVSNVVVHRDYKDQIYPRKQGGKDSPHKIDGVMATLFQLGRLLTGEEPIAPSPYEDEGYGMEAAG
jgi:phage terminase large subunit-like protein